MADALSFEGVSVGFPRRPEPVLRDVSLTLVPGEHVIVFAPSGAGKSTLLKAITGVVPHSVLASLTGTVSVFGEMTTDATVAELSRDVSVLAQDPSAALTMSDVEQELALPLENLGVDPGVMSGRIDTALASVGGGALRRRKTGQLSGGEAQRVALAACLIGRQKVLLLDEPTSMLDAEGIAAVRDAIAGAVDEYMPTVVLVEHRVDEFAGARGLAGLPARAIVLADDGGVLADGPTAEVLDATAPHLHAVGCWLPLEAELRAVFGVAGGLEHAEVRRALLDLAGSPTPAVGTIEHGAAILAAHAVDVGRPGDRVLLAGVDLTFHAGEITAVLGRNGSGKSTLLLTLAGLLVPVAGTITGARPGMIFQNPEHQFVAHTVRGEVAHGLGGGSGPVVEASLAEHRLAGLSAQSPYRLSGGEKRRLSVAAMLAHARPALLADEPTFGLDRRAAIATAQSFRDAARGGSAVVLSSHDVRLVATLAHRIVVLADGAIVADGPAIDVLRDEQLLRRAGVTLPPLVSWLLRECDASGVRRVLEALDATVAPAHAS
jgi:energy-coupling factor transporter ATP-binding protein EcfA2